MNNSNLRAFHGDIALKEMALARVRAHQSTTVAGSHFAYESELGIPERVAQVKDAIFWGLYPSFAEQWRENFLDAIPVGADLSGVWSLFAQWLLVDPQYGVMQFAKDDKQHDAIKAVANLYLQDCLDVTKWVTADAFADSVCAYPAHAAARAFIAVGSYGAVNLVVATALAHALSASSSSCVPAAAKWAAYKRMSEKFLELLRTTPTVGTSLRLQLAA